ncbi:MAG: hypothetical protein J7623_05655 [Chitinophaga sp.]|uniref:hypothetical protein n=1 Tax=Chitinophaga sp. TaxID=1869181 RepID=UPI001B1FF2B8|nr:hypothetical protein [Chitinophaga sp.]MBO9728106.1 hypothetical protein [Chitinophaga sp.]
MLKNILLACVYSMLLPLMLLAQSPKVARSQAFRKPDGASRLLLMKNGNTLYFHFTRKNGIDVVVYDNKHQGAPIVNSQLKSWQPKNMDDISFKGLYEMNGQAVAFLVHYKGMKPCLYRLVFDGNTGKLLREDAVSEDFTGNHPDMNTGFYVQKDPESEYYAVVASNKLPRGGPGERIQITHYSPDHTKLNEAFYESPKGTYRSHFLADIYVHRDDFVFLAFYACDTSWADGKDSKMMVARLSKGAKVFDYKFLDYMADLPEPVVSLRYNSTNKTLYLLSAVSAKGVNKPYTMYYWMRNLVLQMSIIDPYSLIVKNNYFIDHPLLSEYAHTHLKYQTPYYGVIQDFQINADNSISLMYEELAQITSRATTVRLGDIGIARIDESGKEMPGSYAIAKEQIMRGYIDPYFIDRRYRRRWSFFSGFLGDKDMVNNAVFSYDYMFANDKTYVIYNDFPENIDDKNEDSRGKVRMRRVSDANTVLAYHDGNAVKRIYLFGEPENKNVSRFSFLEMNAHSNDNKSYATMMIERHGKSKQAYIVWITF